MEGMGLEETVRKSDFQLSGQKEPLKTERASRDVSYRFRQFHVLPSARKLIYGGTTVELGSRAFDLLVVLLRAQGTLVTKNEIFREVWSTTTVAETNLRFQISALRKALGSDSDMIKTVVGRGYVMVCEDLPVANPENSEIVTTHSGALSIRQSFDNTVILIEDEIGIREGITSLLESVGFRVEAFESVSSFKSSHAFDAACCLILDVWLQDCNGLELQAELVRQGINIPTIFISGHADVQMSVQAMKAGAAEFLTKPLRNQDLVEAVRKASIHGRRKGIILDARPYVPGAIRAGSTVDRNSPIFPAPICGW